ncbi:MAG TPA: DUF5130 family protein [Candidatus Methylacidiphilales bacterium]|jgi:uncharacterized membrane protein|nr:DUF5130 family protein [Candidatus Methylacidiphilales bacterium]
MKVKHFLNALEHARVHAAIKAAEQGTSGDVVVFITHKNVSDPLAAAHKIFRKLRLETATNNDSFLLFLAPKSQKFAVVGGTALHDKAGQAWWDHLSALLTQHFREGRYTDGLVAAIDQAGQKLKQHFPAKATDRTGQQDIVEE